MILSNFIGNASIIELLWVLNCFVGIALSVRNWREAMTDLRLVEHLTNGRHAIALGTLITESLILGKFTIFSILGIFSVALPSNTRVDSSHTDLFVALMLFVASLMLTGISAVNRRTSQYLLKYGVHARKEEE